jgi:hypothetical protein
MNKKRSLVLMLSLILLGSGILLIARQGNSSQQPTLPTPQVPDQVVYKHLLQHVLVLQRKAEQAEKEGKDATQFRTHFNRQANLTDDEVQTLNQVASDWNQEIAPIEARAKALIQIYKAQFPGGQLPHGQTPPPPPPELRTLTEQRDAAVLRARDRLKASFGEDEFNRFQGFIRERVTPNVQMIRPGAASGSQSAEQ